MSRCVACNNSLSNTEICKYRPDGVPEDMCARCLSHVRYSELEPGELKQEISSLKESISRDGFLPQAL